MSVNGLMISDDASLRQMADIPKCHSPSMDEANTTQSMKSLQRMPLLKPRQLIPVVTIQCKASLATIRALECCLDDFVYMDFMLSDEN